MLDLDPGMIIWTWITFAIVLIILSVYALKPILSAIEKREKSIKEDLEEAQNQRQEASELLEKHKAMMSQAESEAHKILKENQQLAEKTRQELLDSARKESDKLIEKARQEIEQQKTSALNELKAEVADLAIGAAEKILVQSLDKDKHKKVVEEYIKSMPKSMKN